MAVQSVAAKMKASKITRQRGKPKEYLRVIASKKRPGARIRLAVRRCFIIGGHLITIRQVLERAYPRLRRFTSWHYLAARRALRQCASAVARNRFGRGRPCLWASKSAAACQRVAKSNEQSRQRP